MPSLPPQSADGPTTATTVDLYFDGSVRNRPGSTPSAALGYVLQDGDSGETYFRASRAVETTPEATYVGYAALLAALRHLRTLGFDGTVRIHGSVRRTFRGLSLAGDDRCGDECIDEVLDEFENASFHHVASTDNPATEEAVHGHADSDDRVAIAETNATVVPTDAVVSTSRTCDGDPFRSPNRSC
jgi:hypothetical protein